MRSNFGMHRLGCLSRLSLPTLVFLLLAGWLGPVQVQAASETDVFQTWPSPGHGTSQLLANGSLLLLDDSTGQPLLTVMVPSLVDQRRGRRLGWETEYVRALLAEGVAGGQRGFSTNADDDQDGQVDEDRHDGKDNDGDGLVDEDFAAISDQMMVVHRQEGSVAVHQELYRWDYSGLGTSTFMAVSADNTDQADLVLAITKGLWQETEISTRYHGVNGVSPYHSLYPFVALVQEQESRQVGSLDQGRSDLWLAVMILDDQPGIRIAVDNNSQQLNIPLSESPLPLVVCAAESWAQLSQSLAMAHRVYQGVSDPVSQKTAPWIVPAPCSSCRLGGGPVFSDPLLVDQTLVLQMNIEPGSLSSVDPDLLSLGEWPLGSPERILWIPAEGKSVPLIWEKVRPADLRDQSPQLASPYLDQSELLAHKALGVLEFRFPWPPESVIPGGADPLEGPVRGYLINGRPFTSQVAPPGKPGIEPVAAGEAASSQDNSATSSDGPTSSTTDVTLKRPPTLAPELLEGWPNPFRDVISLKFKVPQTIEEAFVWVDSNDQPPHLDKQASVPWKGGQPHASVKIYNINGQELRTLHDGNVTDGEYQLSWNGTDLTGRPVASGTYFCKLQLDDWSVTRRIVFLR